MQGAEVLWLSSGVQLEPVGVLGLLKVWRCDGATDTYRRNSSEKLSLGLRKVSAEWFCLHKNWIYIVE
jgi:hypothetical protein